MKLFKDKGLTEPIKIIDLGLVEVGETKDVTVFIHNNSEAVLTNLELKLGMLPSSETLEVVDSPVTIQPWKTGSLTLRWRPSEKFKRALKVGLAIEGQEVYIADEGEGE